MNNLRFQEILGARRVAVVHFSHHALMNHRVTFPDDLHHAISSCEMETRSCCAICPEQRMVFPGSVGIIFKLLYSQLISVSPSDSGSSDFGGEEGSMGQEPTEKAILNSLCAQEDGYNEWRVHGAKPAGIFVANPEHILVKKETVLELDEEMALALGEKIIKDIGTARISLREVQLTFPGIPIFSMRANGLEILCPAAGN